MPKRHIWGQYILLTSNLPFEYPPPPGKKGFPRWLSGKVSTCNREDVHSSPGLGFSWRRKWQPIPVFLPGKFHVQRSLVGNSPRGCKESDTAEHTCTLEQLELACHNYRSHLLQSRLRTPLTATKIQCNLIKKNLESLFLSSFSLSNVVSWPRLQGESVTDLPLPVWKASSDHVTTWVR